MSYRAFANLCCVVMVMMLITIGYLSITLTKERKASINQTRIIEVPVVPKVKKPKVVKNAIEETIAFKNKNLLNIKSLKNDKWKGQIGEDKFGHAIFKDWEYGIRAASYVLKNYSKKHKICTIEGVINRFCTGNRDKYISFLSENLGVKPKQKIELIKYIPKLLKYMAIFESGNHKLPDRLFAGYDVIAEL